MRRFLLGIVVISLFFGAIPAKAAGADLKIEAKSAVLMDVATGTVLYEHNGNEALSPASVTKVMTMLLIMEAIDGGVISWDDTVTASENAAAKGGSQVYLKAGETMTVKDMVKSIAVSSANDCACAMAEHIAGSESAFVDKMNARAKELGMENSHFVNCTGLDDEDEAKNHKLSAYDIALMSRELMKHHPDIKQYTTIWMDTIRDGTFGLSNTNKLVRFYPGATGLKTGFTSQAGFCLSATACRDGMELIAVVMGCENSQKRFAACKSMLDYGFANYAVITPTLESTVQVPVKLGTQAYVQGVLGQDTAMLIEKAQKNMVTTALTTEPAVHAPVSKGQRLGTMQVKAGEQVLMEVPVVAAEPVNRLTYGQILKKVLKAVFLMK